MSDFEHPLSRAYIAKRNKDRSRRQEQRIAKYLSGNRVPMSGSGAIKGDCIVPFDEYRSIFVECKFTEKDILKVYVPWLDKIIEDSRSMRAMFGILVISFYRHSNDYVLISPLGMIQLRKYLGDEIFDAIPTFATAYTANTIPIGRTPDVKRYLQTPHGVWLHTDLKNLKEWLEQIALQSHADD